MYHQKSSPVRKDNRESPIQLNTLKQLYSYSLETHTLKVIYSLTNGSTNIQQLTRFISRNNSEGILIQIRQCIKLSLSNERDEFIDLLTGLFSEQKMQTRDDLKLSDYIRANKQLELENTKLRGKIDELKRQLTPPGIDSRLRGYEKTQEISSHYQKQLESLQRQLDNRNSSQKQLKKELQAMRIKADSEQKKYLKKLKEMQELLNANKREKTHLSEQIKSLNELIRRFEIENTEHIKKYTQATEQIKFLNNQLNSEKQYKSVGSLKSNTYDLKLRDMEIKLEQSETRTRDFQRTKEDLQETKVTLETLANKLRLRDIELKQAQTELERYKKQAHHNKQSTFKRNKQTQDQQPTHSKSVSQFHERQVTALKQSLKDRDCHITELTNQISSIKTSCESKISELQNLNIKLMENLNGESSQLIVHIGKLEQDNTTLVVELKEVVRDYNQSLLEAEDKIMFLNQTITKYQEELQNVYKAKDNLEVYVKQKQTQIEKLKTDANLAQQQLKQLQEENKGLLQHYTKTQEKLIHEKQAEKTKLKQTQLSITKLTERNKTLESEIQRFSSLAETLKKKFKRKMELVLSKIKSSISRLQQQNKTLRDYVKSQLKASRSALQKQFKEELSKFQREFSRYRDIIIAQGNIKIEQLVREAFLLRTQLARRDQQELQRREEKRLAKREILGQLPSVNEAKSLQKQLKRNQSCSNVKDGILTKDLLDIEARRTGFENLKNQIKYQQKRLMQSIGSTSPGHLDY